MTARRRVVPIRLGCCRELERCLLCAPPRPLPDAALVDASVAAVRLDDPEAPIEVRFFGGPPPSDALIEACGAHPFTARVRPDLLHRADVTRLRERGIAALELDILTLHDPALREAGRHYRAARVLEMLDALPGLGLPAPRLGAVLAPGLPASSAEDARSDANRLVGRIGTARLHPVLVLKHSRLEAYVQQGRYEPLTLGAAVTICREMADLLEAGGVDVIRIGVQPAHDGVGRAVAGPRHPALRQLVDARRAAARIEAMLGGVRPGTRIDLRCAPADETVTRGPLNAHVRAWRAAFHLADLRVVPDAALPRGAWRIETVSEEA